MKKQLPGQEGFIPLILMLLMMILGAVALAYWRVSSAT